MSTIMNNVEIAADAIEAIVEAAERVALACKAEMDLEDERPIIKAAAVRRIMERDGIAATPAEKIVESDELYKAHRNRQTQAVVEKQRAFGEYEAQKLRARLSVAVVGGAQ